MFSRPPSHRHRHRSSATSALVTAVSLRGKAGHDERAPLRLEAVDRATYPAPQSTRTAQRATRCTNQDICRNAPALVQSPCAVRACVIVLAEARSASAFRRRFCRPTPAGRRASKC